jgi:hypothetical protein
MSVTPNPAEQAKRIHRGLSRLRINAIGLGVSALVLGVVMAVSEHDAVWLLIAAFGVVWAVVMPIALGAALRAADQAEWKPALVGPSVVRPELGHSPKPLPPRAFSLPHRFQVWFCSGSAVIMGLLAVAVATGRDSSAVTAVLVALFAAFMAWVAWRAQTGRVWISGQSVRVPAVFSTKSYAVADIDHIARGKSTGGWVRWPVAVLVLRDGRRVQLVPTVIWSSHRSQQRLDALIQEMNEQLSLLQ